MASPSLSSCIWRRGTARPPLAFPIMTNIFLECPSTERRVDLGLQARPATVAMLKSMGFLMRCPFCERPHDWRILTLSDWTADRPKAQAGAR